MGNYYSLDTRKTTKLTDPKSYIMGLYQWNWILYTENNNQ